MIVAVTAQDARFDAMTSPIFGRCPAFVFVETETMQWEGTANPAVAAGGGAGIRAAQFVVERGARALLTHDVGPNAFAVLQPAGIEVYRIDGGTVRQAIEAFVAGKLPRLDGSSTTAHHGMKA